MVQTTLFDLSFEQVCHLLVKRLALGCKNYHKSFEIWDTLTLISKCIKEPVADYPLRHILNMGNDPESRQYADLEMRFIHAPFTRIGLLKRLLARLSCQELYRAVFHGDYMAIKIGRCD